MSILRRIARRILRFANRLAPAESRAWGDAILRELDYVEDDWGALRWALGGTTAVGWYSLTRPLHKRTLLRFGMVTAGIILTIALLSHKGETRMTRPAIAAVTSHAP